MAIANARLVMFQLYCRLALIPACVKRENDNKPKAQGQQQPRIPGKKHLEKVQSIGVADLDCKVKSHGYTLVDATVKPVGEQALVNFTMAKVDQAVICPEFEAKRPLVEQALSTLLSEALWDTEIWDNPFFKDGKPFGDERVFVIKLDGRRALVDCHGQMILQWRTDSSGRRVGDKAVPIEADVCLKVTDNGITVASV